MPKIVTGVSLDDYVIVKIKQLAKLEGRPLSNYVNRVLLNHITKKIINEKPVKLRRKKV